MDLENHDEALNIFMSIRMFEGDYFKDLYSDTLLKKITIVFFFAGSIFGLLLEAGIIWYERNGNHRYRTAINQLFSTISWLVVLYILIVYIPEGIRYLIGPLDATYCDVHNFLKNFFWNCAVLTLDCIITLRYIIIFKWKNLAVVNDDLITRFLQLTILIVGLWITAVKRLSLGRMPMNYFMCTGINPDETNGNNKSGIVHKQYDTSGLLVCVSFVLHIFVFTKIFLYERKMEKKINSIKLGIIKSSGNIVPTVNSAWAAENQKRSLTLPKSMGDLLTQFLCLAHVFSSTILLFVMNKMSPAGLNEYQNRWIIYWNQLIGTSVVVLGISTTYYIRNPYVSKAIWRNIKENLRL